MSEASVPAVCLFIPPRDAVRLVDKPGGDYFWRHEIRSTSNPDMTYVIAVHVDSGEWTCSCPGWINRRRCRHVASLAPIENPLATRESIKFFKSPAPSKTRTPRLTPEKVRRNVNQWRERDQASRAVPAVQEFTARRKIQFEEV